MALAANVNPNSKYPSIFLETRMFEAGVEVFRFHYDRMMKSDGSYEYLLSETGKDISYSQQVFIDKRVN
ncbi:MAG: hypothetical protein ACTSR4_02825 [Candidatus Hodarchaeales archaeon]